MKRILEACESARPITVTGTAFLAGLAYGDGYYYYAALAAFTVCTNIPFMIKTGK
ncbi:hypothetical protein [Chryseobacterium sp.]|uniref:hypothetical protein n=1 Tax=Chryseobacterium sp. TaxID=1871047 RepID=UPI0024E25AD2|nr:hypothetical protein [Chryseobacterium sp.]